ncbi:zinc ion binding [Striga asiatica]|uniref:Zinc ion binding n=1 Tax=Striga asiatica TaxID=4170 RepID=A0A5A7RAV8_STRAF|nr:zinc ion binding [Striga asiatica]
MECAVKGSRTPCCGPPTRRCHRCQAVAYCSLAHQVSHKSVHRRECERLEQQIKRIDVLNSFPFTFTPEIIQVEVETRCSFLTGHKIHCLGMWMYECSCGVSDITYDNSRLITCWNLPSELCPCKGPSSSVPKCLCSWKEYYEWRCIPLNSPAALLLHWPLTIYWAIQLATRESLLPQITNELRIHYLGPEKELHQLAVFGELQALFPGVKIHIDLIGPAIPQFSLLTSLDSICHSSESFHICMLGMCNEMDCGCKHPVEYQKERIITSCCSYPVKLQLHAGFYHDCYGKLLKDSLPHIILAPNAGIAAYTSWVPTLEVIKQMHVPLVLSDYCEEASHLAASCISSTTGTALKIQIQINPFRQPFRVEESALCLPCYSNCFVFGF